MLTRIVHNLSYLDLSPSVCGWRFRLSLIPVVLPPAGLYRRRRGGGGRPRFNGLTETRSPFTVGRGAEVRKP